MFTSVLKHVNVERKKRWWKDRRGKKRLEELIHYLEILLLSVSQCGLL